MTKLIGVIWIGVAIAAGGWFIGHGFARGHETARYVRVKGVAQKNVSADLAIWPVRFVQTGNKLDAVQTALQGNAKTVQGFLTRYGIPAKAIHPGGVSVTDLYAQAYHSGPIKDRYIVSQTVMVRTRDVAAVERADRHLSDLVADQVVLGTQGPGGGKPSYLFTHLSRIKPGMIHEATLHARAAAEQFAKDSDSRLGGIRRAYQGTFVILPRDQAPGISQQSQPLKTVRVVSHLEFLLRQ